MSLIKNLVKEPEKKETKKKTGEDDEDNENETKDDKNKVRPIIKSATDLQRLKLEKLMKDPQKPIIIAESRREKDYMASVPTFVRNVMGSSAGAGSGEFHVYRHLRRKEYARQKIIQAKSAREEADEAYQQKIEDNRRIADEKTAKKRAKRLKKKQRAKKSRPANSDQQPNNEEHNSTDSESNEEEDTTSNTESKNEDAVPQTEQIDEKSEEQRKEVGNENETSAKNESEDEIN